MNKYICKRSDILLCISDSYSKVTPFNDQKCHIEGRYYKIDDITVAYIYVVAEKGSTWNGYYGYKNDEFSEHFISLKELRKQKLNKISEQS